MMPAKTELKYPITDNWIFLCDITKWEADRFLETGETKLFYKVTDRHVPHFREGQLGILRVGDDERSQRKLAGHPRLEKGIYAIFEVAGKPKNIPDPDTRFCPDPAWASERRWRAPVRVIASLLANLILARHLPPEPQFDFIRHAQQASTWPIERGALEYILQIAGLGYFDPQDVSLGPDGDPSEHTAAGIHALEEKYADAVPKFKVVISARIERGSIGKAVKRERGCRCQACEALGLNPVAFLTSKGSPYAEAHHVIPVHRREQGSLHYLNIMVLCPNHHRQAHHGRFKIESNSFDHWMISIDDRVIRIGKTLSLSLRGSR